MFSHRLWGKHFLSVLASGSLVLCIVPNPTAALGGTFATSSRPARMGVQQAPASLSFVRVFSSADDVRAEHPVLDRALNIIAGPADPDAPVEAMHSPSAVTTDSNHRVFVADPGAKAVH